jgi:hypothetical protein
MTAVRFRRLRTAVARLIARCLPCPPSLLLAAVIEGQGKRIILYNWDILFYHRPVDAARFVAQVRKGGWQCRPLRAGESAEI